MSKVITELICSVIILGSIAYYAKEFKRLSTSDQGARIIANASQWTFTAFILGDALIMIWINIVGLGRGKFILAIFCHAAIVSLINFLALKYYQKHEPN